jgi:hypothetical protein
LSFSLVGLVPAVTGCSDETVDDGSTSGTLAVYVATFDDGTTRTEYALMVNGDESDQHTLHFTGAPPDLPTGAEIKIWGEMRAEGIHVREYEVVRTESSDGLGKSREAIIDGSPYPSRSLGYLLVDIGNGTGSYTVSQAELDLLGTGASDGSVKQWFLEASYGRQDISGAVAGGLSYDMNGCNYSNLASGLRSAANAALGITPQHYLWFFLTNNNSCSWSGLASVGSAMTPARDTWYNASSSCTVLVQEPAHNFGMQHSSSLRCGSSAFANDPSDCTHDEYGDRHDPMGGGCWHTNAWQKGYQGWFGGCNSVRVNQSGTFTVHPIEVECNGIQVLQIPMPVTNRTIPRSGGGGQPSNDPVQFYYLELRTRTGFDQPNTAYPTVLVRVGPDYRSRTQTGLHTWLLDMQPSSTGQNSFQGLGAGQSFTDPAGGVSFSVQSIDSTKASIQVTVATNSANTCAFGSGNLTAPGPDTCGATGGTGGMGGMGGMAGTGGMAGRAGGGAGGAGSGGMAGRAGGGAGGAGAGGAGSGGAGAGGTPAGGAGAGGAPPGGAAGDGGLGGLGGQSGGGLGGLDAGAAGSAGAAAGAAGVAGAPAAGAGGLAGATSTAGSAGAPTGAGTGNIAGAGTVPRAPGTPDDDGGCGCRIEKTPPRHEGALWIGALAVLAGGIVRRRRSKAN